jgi:hypothetical protein
VRGDIEDLCAAIVSELRGPKFAAALAEIAAEKSDAVAVPVPAAADIHFGERPITDAAHGEVAPLDGKYDEESDSKDGAYRIAVTWFVPGYDEELVTRTVLRYVRATRDALWRSTLAEQLVNAGPIAIASEDYSELIDRGDGAPILRAGRTVLKVTSYTL